MQEAGAVHILPGCAERHAHSVLERHRDRRAVAHGRREPGIRQQAHARLRQRDRGQPWRARRGPAADDGVARSGGARAPGLDARQVEPAVALGRQRDPVLRRFGAPDAPDTVRRRRRRPEFGQNRQGVGVSLEAFGQGQVDGGHGGQRPPPRQRVAAAGQGQAVAAGRHQGAHQGLGRADGRGGAGQHGVQAIETEARGARKRSRGHWNGRGSGRQFSKPHAWRRRGGARRQTRPRPGTPLAQARTQPA
ncbi:hypothetical protein LMG26845_05936 [Achromobacter insuavis]|uniref:Uncharacterized protein n=1 Tax=Achromobacter insuavis TaxID=1287735 RepID=A0A6J5BRG1_9BURK|nr:hypothetical protein LMG26845_05936 [Achromobacter insuavis]